VVAVAKMRACLDGAVVSRPAWLVLANVGALATVVTATHRNFVVNNTNGHLV
jgi:hypothetical protein